MMEQSTASLSGGWRMRVALARGLYMQPQLLLLDEPTNHLDINSVIWLTDYLKTKWKKTLVVVSHDIHFINQVCTKIVHIENKKLNYYNGNYTSFKNTYNQNNSELEKQWNKIQRRVKEMRNKSTKKDTVDKFIKDNAHFEPIVPYKVNIRFYETDPIKSPYINLIDITAGYSTNLFQNINLSIGAGEKITIVGKNGVGKSTLLQLISGNKSVNFTGEFEKNPNVAIGYYNQHLTDILPLDKTPIEYLVISNSQIDEFSARKYLGSIGLEGQIHTRSLSTLSGGQKARVALALINSIKPHILLLDEPTNHLDIESIEAITLAINNFNGSVIMITHNIDIIERTKSKILKLENFDLVEVDFDDYYDDVLNEVENI
jgi:ATP-binding cassette subfamily F protein 1